MESESRILLILDFLSEKTDADHSVSTSDIKHMLSQHNISIRDTRGIIDAILDGSILKTETKKIPYFDFEVPTSLPGVDPKILDPRDTYANVEDWETKAKDLAGRFIKNFVKYEGNEAGKALVAAGPKL